MGEIAFLRLSFLPAILVAALVFFAAPEFSQMYIDFGTQLPPQTIFFFKWYKLLAFVPFLSFATWYFWPRRESRGSATLCASAFLSGIMLLFGIWAAYMPLVMLGSQ